MSKTVVFFQWSAFDLNAIWYSFVEIHSKKLRCLKLYFMWGGMTFAKYTNVSEHKCPDKCPFVLSDSLSTTFQNGVQSGHLVAILKEIKGLVYFWFEILDLCLSILFFYVLGNSGIISYNLKIESLRMFKGRSDTQSTGGVTEVRNLILQSSSPNAFQLMISGGGGTAAVKILKFTNCSPTFDMGGDRLTTIKILTFIECSPTSDSRRGGTAVKNLKLTNCNQRQD